MMVGRLGYNSENGRYGLLVSDLWEDMGFHCGECLEVMVDDKWGLPEWKCQRNRNGIWQIHLTMAIWNMCRRGYKVREESRAGSVKYLRLCDKYFIGWLRKQAPDRAQNPLAGLVAFDAERQKCFYVTFDKSNKTYSASDFACRLVFGWNMAALGKHLCKTLYYNLYNNASRNFLPEEEK